MKRFGIILFLGAAVFALVRLTGETRAETKYIDQATAMKTMMQWSKDLGVKCGYCHTSDQKQTIESLEGKTASAAELTPLLHRRIALDMEAMMQLVNQKQKAQLTCGSCHQGAAQIPVKSEESEKSQGEK
jgi:hypothetical protein